MHDEMDLSMEVKFAAGAAGVTTCAHVCPSGQTWKIIGGFFSHDDATARSGYASLTLPPDSIKPIADLPSTATNIRTQLYGAAAINALVPITLHAGETFHVTLAAIAGGNILTVVLLVLVRYGDAY